jgi:NADH:ubiquinone oxidoreductase subunit 6 (subunit J)
MLTIQTPEAVMFWILGPLSVIAAIGMLVVKKAVHSALLLAWIMITIALFCCLYRRSHDALPLYLDVGRSRCI